jgi:beta-hydroxyacyl-ACP dehydratase FabZ
MDQKAIEYYLPHRFPFLLIDAVHELHGLERIVASRKLTGDEPIFAGHFPNNPVYPGVYLIESVAQTGGILTLKLSEAVGITPLPLGFLSSVESCRFRRPCRPGDELIFDVTLTKTRSPFFWLTGKVTVNGEEAATISLTVAMLKPEAGMADGSKTDTPPTEVTVTTTTTTTTTTT